MKARSTAYSLALTSAIFTAIYVTMDTFITRYLVGDAATFAAVCEIIGAVVARPTIAVLQIRRNGSPLGARIDPRFKGITLIPKNSLLRYLATIVFGGLGTAAYFYGVSKFSPATMLPLLQLTTIYLLIIDALQERTRPSIAEIHAILSVSLGSVLATIEHGAMDRRSVLFALGPMNVLNTLRIFSMQRLAKVSNVDTVNLRFRIINGLAVTTTLSVLPFVDPINIIRTLGNVRVRILTSIDMTLVFLAVALYIRALALGKMSVVNAILSFSIVLGLPITIIMEKIMPGVFGGLPSDRLIRLVRLAGITFVTIGVIDLSLSEIAAYILLRVSPGYLEKTLEFLKGIKYVRSIAVLSGEYDIIAEVRVRSMGGALAKLLTRIHSYEGVEDMITQIVVKEYERHSRTEASRAEAFRFLFRRLLEGSKGGKRGPS